MPGHFNTGHDWPVAGLHAPVRKIDRGRGLGRARHAYEHDIGLLKAFEMLAVLVHDCVVETGDVIEILRVERVLRAYAVRGLSSQIRLYELQARPQNRKG